MSRINLHTYIVRTHVSVVLVSPHFSFYCDICNSLRDLNNTVSSRADITKDQQSFAEQFSGIECPRRPTKKRLVRQFCFNDWNVFDTDGDCKFDFLPSDYKTAIRTIGQVGFVRMEKPKKGQFNIAQSVNDEFCSVNPQPQNHDSIKPARLVYAELPKLSESSLDAGTRLRPQSYLACCASPQPNDPN